MEKRYPTLPVPIGNAKETGEMEYHSIAPPLEYHQNSLNSFSSAVQDLHSLLQYKITLQGLSQYSFSLIVIGI